MLICLSSGSRPRYRQDVLRAISLPIGTQLQFRYDKKWTSTGVLQMIDRGLIIGKEVLIAYADQSQPESEGKIELVPIRLATISGATAPGSTVSLTFSLGPVVYAANLMTFNSEITELARGTLPKWIDGNPSGLYCDELNSRPASVVEIEDLGGWELVVTQLSQRKDFESEETFFTVVGLLTEDELSEMISKLRHVKWPNALSADEDRELVIYHYHDNKSPTNFFISATFGSHLNIVSPPRIRLDSRYDVKKLRIRTGDPTFRKRTWITLSADTESTTGTPELDMEVIVKANLLKRIVTVTAIAIGLTVVQVVTLVTRTDLSGWGQAASGLAILVFSILVAVSAVWGIRRGI